MKNRTKISLGLVLPKLILIQTKGHALRIACYARQGIVTPEMEFIAIREKREPRSCSRGR